MNTDYRPFFFLVSFVFLVLGFIINGVGSIDLPAVEATADEKPNEDTAPPFSKILAVILYAIAVAVCLVGLYL